MKKNLLLAFGLIGISATPLIATISCGKKSEEGSSNKGDTTPKADEPKSGDKLDNSHTPAPSVNSISFGLREEEKENFKPMIAQFEKATGVKVETISIGDQWETYKASHIPDVTLADASTAKKGEQEHWFKQIDLKDIVENPTYLINSTVEYVEDKNLRLDSNHFEMNMINTEKSSVADRYRGLPIIYGPKLMYSWKSIQGVNILDGTKDLKWFIPKVSATGTTTLEEVTSFNTGNETNSPLFSKKSDHHRLKNTHEDIQEFILNSALKSDVKFNKRPINANSLSGASTIAPEDLVIATGALGQSQRLKSVGISLNKAFDISAHSTNFKAPFMEDYIPRFEEIIQGTRPMFDASHQTSAISYEIQGGVKVLDDDKWLQKDGTVANTNDKWIGSGDVTISKTNLTPIMSRAFEGDLGYFGKECSITNEAAQEPDVQTAFAKQSTLFLAGANWQYQSIVDRARDGNIPREDLTAYAVPFQTAGVDGYSIAANIPDSRFSLAKKFLRFMMQKKVSSDIASNRTAPVVLGAKKLMPNTSEIDRSLSLSGYQPNSDYIDWIDYLYSRQSDSNLFDLYADSLSRNSWTTWTTNNKNTLPINMFIDRINEVNRIFKQKLATL